MRLACNREDQHCSLQFVNTSWWVPVGLRMCCFMQRVHRYKGDCGTRPALPGGNPKIAQGKNVHPSTKKSQWYAGGFVKLNLGSCIKILPTLWSMINSIKNIKLGIMAAKNPLAVMSNGLMIQLWSVVGCQSHGMNRMLTRWMPPSLFSSFWSTPGKKENSVPMMMATKLL